MSDKEPPILPSGVEQQEPIEETTDTELPSTEDIQPPLVQVEIQVDKPIEEPFRKHRFHPRPDYPLHLPNEEPVLGYLKFIANGTKREVFVMPILGNLVTANIQGIPEKEPRFDDEEADVQRVFEESLKSVYDTPRGLLPPVVVREPELPLTYLISIPTGSSSHDESSSLYAEVGLTDSDVESDEDVPRIDAGGQEEGQAEPNPGEQDKVHARPNLGEQDEGQAGPNLGDATVSPPLSGHVVH
nr:hypothetical protein [Tanacetum cinerariifolium]